MMRYATKADEKKSAKVYGKALPISNKDSKILCKRISGMELSKARELLLGLLSETKSLDGKFYTKTAFEIAKILNSVGSNAEFKGLDAEKMKVKASAHEGYTFYRPRRFKNSRTKKKVTHIQIVLVR